MSSGRCFEGLFVGGCLGVLAGILYAPKAGRELRKQIANGSDEIYRQAGSQLTDFKGKGDQALHELQNRGDAVIKQAATQVMETRDQIAAKIQDFTGKKTRVPSGTEYSE